MSGRLAGSSSRSRVPWPSLALAVLVMAVYAPVATHDFLNYDDPLYITDNSRIDGSVELLEGAVRQAPDQAYMRFNLARALEAAGRREAAIAQLKAVLLLTPEDAEARRWLAALRAGR